MRLSAVAGHLRTYQRSSVYTHTVSVGAFKSKVFGRGTIGEICKFDCNEQDHVMIINSREFPLPSEFEFSFVRLASFAK